MDVSSASVRTAPAEEAWLDAPWPALLARGQELSAVNTAAAVLFPEATAGRPISAMVPRWLAEAHQAHQRRATGADTPPASGAVGQRSFEAHPVDRPLGGVMWWLVEDTDVRQAREELRLERERTALLAEVSSALLTSLNELRCREITAHLAATHLADAAVVITPASDELYPVTTCVRGGVSSTASQRIDPGEVAGLAEALEGFPPTPSRWIDPAGAPDWLLPDGFAAAGAVAVVPLPGHGVAAGVLVLLRREDRPAFGEAEETFARLFAARAGIAMSAARMFAREATITDTLMRELLPPAISTLDGVEYAGRYQASGESDRVGGDFYDVHPPASHPVNAHDDGAVPMAETLVVLGDVCGKGLEAAVLTGRVRTALRTLKHMTGDHLAMLTLLNDALVNERDTRFVTLVVASVSRAGQRVRVRLSSAGHPPPLIVRTTAAVQEVDTSGTLIGVLPDIETTTREVFLEPGETCLLYTDGVTEARGGPLGNTMFGEQRLREALAGCAGMPAEAVAEHVHMLAGEWVGRGRHDDIAVLAITAPRGRHLTAVGGHSRGRYTA